MHCDSVHSSLPQEMKEEGKSQRNMEEQRKENASDSLSTRVCSRSEGDMAAVEDVWLYASLSKSSDLDDCEKNAVDVCLAAAKRSSETTMDGARPSWDMRFPAEISMASINSLPGSFEFAELRQGLEKGKRAESSCNWCVFVVVVGQRRMYCRAERIRWALRSYHKEPGNIEREILLHR